MKIALIFPGYGSQFVGMGKELYDNHRIVQEYFEEASNCLNINFVKLCFASSDSELGKATNAYTSMFLVSSALVGLLKQEGISFDVVAGYNNGDYAALFAAGGISLPDGLYLLNKYTTFYQEALDQMSAKAIRVVGISAKRLALLCDKASTKEERAYIAIYETDKSHIVAGHKNAVDLVRDMASDMVGKNKVDIDVVSSEVGLHSPLMNPIVDQFKIYLEKVDFKDLAVPMIESVNGRQIKRGTRIREHVIEHIHEPVKWTKIMNALNAYDVVVEVGPGTTLSALVRAEYPDKRVIAINKQSDIDELKSLIQSVAQAAQPTEK